MSDYKNLASSSLSTCPVTTFEIVYTSGSSPTGNYGNFNKYSDLSDGVALGTH